MADLHDVAGAMVAVRLDGLALGRVPEEVRTLEVVRAAVEQNGMALAYAPEGLRGDRALVLAAVAKHWGALAHASDDLRGDMEVVVKAVELSGRALALASPELRSTSEVVMAAVAQDGESLCDASEELRADKAVVLEAVTRSPHALVAASEELRADYDVVMPAIRKDGRMLQFSAEKIRRDPEAVEEALASYDLALELAHEAVCDNLKAVMTSVGRRGCSLAFASARLRDTEEVVRAAVSQDGLALQHASPRLLADRDLVEAALSQDGRALAFADGFRGDRELVLAAVSHHGSALAEAAWSLRADRGVVLAAVGQDGHALLSVAPDLRSDRDVVHAAVSRTGAALAYASDEQRHDAGLVGAAVRQDGMALLYAPAELRRDFDIVHTAVAQNGLALQFADRELRNDAEIALAAVEQSVDALAYVSPELRGDEGFVRFASCCSPDLVEMLGRRRLPLARKWALARLRRLLEPKLKAYHLNWVDGIPALRRLAPLEELQAGFTDPQTFVAGLENRGEPVSKAWALAKARPGLRPHLQKEGVEWEDMVPALEASSKQELHVAFEKPAEFLRALAAKNTGLPAKLWLVARLRPALQPLLPKGIYWWEDARPALEIVETAKQLRQFVEAGHEGAELLIWKLSNDKEWPPAAAFRLRSHRLRLEQLLPAGVQWQDAVEMLLVLDPEDTWDGLPAAVADVARLTQLMEADPRRLGAQQWAIARLRPALEGPMLREGNTWSEVVDILRKLDTGDDLLPALQDPRPLMGKLPDLAAAAAAERGGAGSAA